MISKARGRRVLALAMAVLGVVVAFGAPAAAAPADSPGWATLNGRRINLSQGWGSAQVCAVYSRRVVRCYDSTAKADTALGSGTALNPPSALAAAPACTSGWLCLYADTNGGGRRLQFRDEYWNYLSDYSFDRQTSSWRNAQASGDNGYLSLYNSTSVYLCAAGSSALTMGSYDNQAYAVWG